MNTSTRFRNEIHIMGDQEEIWGYLSTLEGYLSFFADSGVQHGDELVMEYGGITNRVEIHVLTTNQSLQWRHAYEISGKEYPLITTFYLQSSTPYVIVRVEVSGFGQEPDDLFVKDLMDETWTRTLFNLKSVVELGSDIRQALFGHRRLGILSTGISDGNRVLYCFEGSPAAAAGLRAGDIIRSIDDRPVTNHKALVRELARNTLRKSEIVLNYEREGILHNTMVKWLDE
ncbi:PDZ domain-containing protein [Paenibacillus provencensis]|uniref:PDZ domain-containing protein n=1 Tax=Paenibacillus provencensis TaxID=441151 RepID=A0ABW3PTM6_9BACL|nr:PDZ domain-containing protein [Paenibacillus sp. MER 78]MCM3129680.1 PDZ domain-containing protein [Paenibacillus sp. MER 78]